MTLDEVVKDIADTVKESVGEAIASVKARYDARIKELEEKIEAIPKSEKGADGDSVTIEDVKPLIEEAVAAIEIPAPEKGDAGIAPTADEVAKSMEGIFSKWALDFERKADGVLSKAVDKLRQPEDGSPGRDALELEDFDLTIADDNRTVTMSLKRGETVIEKSIKLPVPLDAGIYRDSESYEKGDGVSYGGSWWIAQKDAPDGKPGVGEDWRLSVKRGRDGRESVKIEKPKTVKV